MRAGISRRKFSEAFGQNAFLQTFLRKDESSVADKAQVGPIDLV